MSTQPQIDANRANAQFSTGPNTAEGRAKVAANGLTHRLNASQETLFAAQPDLEEAYRTLAHKLRKDCQPDSSIEEETFQLYAWSLFQAKRAQRLELSTENRWLEDPDDSKRFSQMERVIKLAVTQARRATQALNELRRLQRDRFAAYEVYAEHCVMGKDVQIPKSLPVADIRKTDLGRTNPNYLAQFLLYQTKEVKDKAKEMLQEAKEKAKTKANQAKLTNEQTKPKFDPNTNPFAEMSIEQLLKIAKDAGIRP